MNYIKQLQADVKEKQEKIENTQREIQAFKMFLHSPKFQSTETERKDWIATGDVFIRLQEILNVLS
jgi:hypothetical protein